MHSRGSRVECPVRRSIEAGGGEKGGEGGKGKREEGKKEWGRACHVGPFPRRTAETREHWPAGGGVADYVIDR